MKMNDKIENLETKLGYSSPNKTAAIVKKLVRNKDIFINGK